MSNLDALAARWRADAEVLRRNGADQLAHINELHATELEAALRDEAATVLTLAQAVAESGYSERRLRELATAGELPNVGRKHVPRFRRGDLPKKAKRDAGSGYDPLADARDLLTMKRAG